MSDDFLENQKDKRDEYLRLIINSQSNKKIIVAGPGTGKTYTFKQLLRASGNTNNLALTFIRKLVADMEESFGDIAEVKTFHAYCKKLLHIRNGRIVLAPYLTKVIEEDAALLGSQLSNFDNKFQTLDESSREIAFYLGRGDYYEAVSFNDSVYRLYRYVKKGDFELPVFNQIVIDEFQDFNALEVAFIQELGKNSPILIVGDDDQAVYINRGSSPEHLRQKYKSGEYEKFELPFCSRSPRVIVEATSSFIQYVHNRGKLRSRIDKKFIPYLEDKEYENKIYPKIIKATTSNILILSKYIESEINKIPDIDIKEAHQNKYPCVLIVGKTQFLNPLAKFLKDRYSNTRFSKSSPNDYSYIDAYKLLKARDGSNLGWRLLAQLEYSKKEMREIIKRSLKGISMIELLTPEFLEKHQRVVEILRSEKNTPQNETCLKTILGENADEVISYFFLDAEDIIQEIDETQPIIMLSTFEGCKGLSAGHVFIVGLNENIVPKIRANGEISDIEYCKFIVALTRTRKKCHLLSNLYHFRSQKHRSSPFLNLIPQQYLKDLGYLSKKDFND
ncbi:MAG: AAA family ATPase [Candidatus Tenebribacter davisii]|nr:AAA family ATPase [Candidatus Tenebribacter davisii]